MRKPELLAPAGNASMMHAAVRAGSDAVYLGLQSFNARRNAENFDDETFPEAVKYCHLRGVKVYVAMNTLVLPSEMDDAVHAAKMAARTGVDGFIVQDLGLLSRLQKSLPNVRLHASTQMNIHSVDGLHAACALGIKRVVLSRELSLEEISKLCEVAHSLDIEIETFAHGALCVSYSGQCLMSSMIGARSANRGLCAQACRLTYKLVDLGDEEQNLPSPGEYLLSPKDLCTIADLPALFDAGVDSLKIEGRMKSPEYVFTTVREYRVALDAIHEDVADLAMAKPPELENPWYNSPRVFDARSTPEQASEHSHKFDYSDSVKRLQSVFTRGFTNGYLYGQSGNDIMAYTRPNNRGESVGRVKAVSGGILQFSCNRVLSEGDVLEVWTSRGNVIVPVDDDFSQSNKGARVQLPKDVEGIHVGDRVFRVRSAEATYIDDEREPRIHIEGEVTLRIGAPLQVTFWPTNNSEILASSFGDIVESARTREVSAEEVAQHIDRLGQTPFTLDKLDVNLDDNVGIGFSALHHVRTDALVLLEAAILQGGVS